MLSLTKSIFMRGGRNAKAPSNTRPVSEIVLSSGNTFALKDKFSIHNEMPYLDWGAVNAWVDSLEGKEDKAQAWAQAELVWLEHLRAALGEPYWLCVNDSAVVLSTLTPGTAKATLNYMERTNQRILQVLSGIAELPPLGRDILIVFDDDDAYYRYASHYYPDEGEFAFSSGMHVSAGCSHFITQKQDLHVIEPVIAHECTHGCLSHLPLPLWLNEGLAVNMEARLTGSKPSDWTPAQLRARHLDFWGIKEIQEFWSGKSFYRTDDGNRLSYDLARILVEHFSTDWQQFKTFVLNANNADSGASAASEHLGVELGIIACTLMEEPELPGWQPDPASWDGFGQDAEA
jgi:hypothetical protein